MGGRKKGELQPGKPRAQLVRKLRSLRRTWKKTHGAVARVLSPVALPTLHQALGPTWPLLHLLLGRPTSTWMQAFIAGLCSRLRLANIWRRHCHRRLDKQSPFALAPGNQGPAGGASEDQPHLHASCRGTVECLPQAQLDPRTLISAADWAWSKPCQIGGKLNFMLF